MMNLLRSRVLQSITRVGLTLAPAVLVAFGLVGCKKQVNGDGAPPPSRVVEVPDMNLITIPDGDVPKFPVAKVSQIEIPSELNVTGTVNPDVSREVPVISVANGRVIDVKTRLGDNVKKGQLLFTVQSADVTNAFNNYLRAVHSEAFANKAYLRAQDLSNHGAISQAMLEQAQTTEDNAKADLIAAEEQLNLYGIDKSHPTDVANVYAPISGVVTSQNVTNAAAAGVALSGSATAFTIADLSSVWVLCDVFENDLPKVHVGQEARIVLNAYPDRPLKGRISDIGPVLDPSLRTAKVRIQVANPGFLKLGMFATASFISNDKKNLAVAPADAVFHLHDRDWVYVPVGGNQFRRVEVRAGRLLDDGRQQEILSGISPGQQVVTHALLLDTAGNQK